ncbi:MAG: 4'-phosphopantetheinyl transferase superfamily protein [Chloroflexales bacterium]|nr:4'-phosphopantetheinyl transferase superfamily protein [Chloroflexales bacterium]
MPGPRDQLWPRPQTMPPLNGEEVHLWRAPLEIAPELRARLGQTLSPDERARAERFVFEADSRRWSVARGVLRALLGLYLGCAPEEVRLRYMPRGKPLLDGAHADLHFNLSHSHELALYAITRGVALGVDIEHIDRPGIDHAQLARSVLSAEERSALDRLAPALRQAAFWHCWTRKEAFVKALGAGLSFPLDQFAVAVHPDEPARVLAVRGDPDEAAAWSLVALAPADRHVGALAYRGPGRRIRCWEWPVS